MLLAQSGFSGQSCGEALEDAPHVDCLSDFIHRNAAYVVTTGAKSLHKPLLFQLDQGQSQRRSGNPQFRGPLKLPHALASCNFSRKD